MPALLRTICTSIVSGSKVQAVSMLKGDLPLPWEEGLSKQQRQQLGLFKDPIMQLLQRDPGERSDMLTFRNACNKLFAAATSAPGDN